VVAYVSTPSIWRQWQEDDQLGLPNKTPSPKASNNLFGGYFEVFFF
jgi:hypothetical protein